MIESRGIVTSDRWTVPEKKRIAVVAIDVKLPGEARGLDREPYIAERLVETGYEVDLITSSFQHWEKSQRDTTNPAYAQTPYRTVFIDAPSIANYKKNITPTRVINHAYIARKVGRYLRGQHYDLVFVRVPPNDLARACAKYTQDHGIPLVVDVNDLWPEAMRMVFDVPVLRDVAFGSFKRDADYVYRHATAVIGTSDGYAHRALDAGAYPQLMTVYVGSDIADFDAAAAACAIAKPTDEFWITYAGTIGTSYDIESLVRAASLLKNIGHDEMRLMILGEGPERERLIQLAAELDVNATFLGYLPYEEMVPYLVASDLLVNSFVSKAPQSIVSKVGDYLAAGKPMINTLANPEFVAKVSTDGFGINIPPEDPVALAAAILELQKDEVARITMGQAARRIAEEQFDRPRAYTRIVDLINVLLQ